jgi:hypothetical protein
MRLTLQTDLITRDGTTAKDAKLVNAFIDGEDVFKRPSILSVLATASGQAQGGVSNKLLAYMINGDVLRSYNSAGTIQDNITL